MTEFSPLGLTMDSDEMLGRLKSWVECESPSWDANAVNRMADIASYELSLLDARIDRIPIPGFGDALRARLPHPAAGSPGILLLGHLDTVHPIGSMAFRRDGERCYGPGILDMKAGNFLAVDALRVLQLQNIQTPLPVTILFTSDEEVGSKGSRALIEAEAQRNKYVLVPEPARPDGSLVCGRHTVARYILRTEGKSGHAGHMSAMGVSAIREMAEKVVELEGLSNQDAFCRVGVIKGGKWVNCIPMTCEAELLIVAKTQSAFLDLQNAVESAVANYAGATFHFERGPVRPFWHEDKVSNPIFQEAKVIARELGFSVDAVTSGGGSDGNFTGHMGVPTLDGLGAQGDHLHTADEHIIVESLAQRGKLMAGLFARLQ